LQSDPCRQKWIDDKSKQESQFNLDAIKESIERMKPELVTCSEAAHKAKDAGDDPEFDRVVELGSLVECLGGMCGPHLIKESAGRCWRLAHPRFRCLRTSQVHPVRFS
jgi:hypothetical protein